MHKDKIKATISSNMRKALSEFRKRTTTKEKCKCCGRPISNKHTQEWVGKQVGLSKAIIVHYFQGVRLPSIERLFKIAEVLEVSPEYFFKEEN